MIVITFHYRKANTKLLNESNRYVSLCVLFSFVYLEEKLNFSRIAQIFRKVKELWKAKITNSAVTAINVNKCTQIQDSKQIRVEDTKILLDFDLSRNSALFARESLISLVIIVQHRMEYVFMIILYRMIISSASPRNRIVDRLYPIVWRSEELCSISIVLHFLCYLIFYLFIFSYVMILPFCEEFIFLSLLFHLAKMIFVFQPILDRIDISFAL